MSRAIPTFIVVLIITAIFVVVGQWQSSNKTAENLEFEKVEAVEKIVSMPKSLPIQSDLTTPSMEAEAELGLWTEIVEIPTTAPAIRSDIAEKRLIKLNRASLSALSTGQEINIIIPHLDSPVRVSIRTVDKLASGNTSIVGKVDGNPLLDFVMTVSEKSTFATIGTAQGVFSLRGDESLAWIAPASAFNHHVDPTVPDFRIPKPPVAQAAANPG